jgi:hypothetical protein
MSSSLPFKVCNGILISGVPVYKFTGVFPYFSKASASGLLGNFVLELISVAVL